MKKNIFLCHGDIGLFRNILDEIDQENDKISFKGLFSTGDKTLSEITDKDVFTLFNFLKNNSDYYTDNCLSAEEINYFRKECFYNFITQTDRLSIKLISNTEKLKFFDSFIGYFLDYFRKKEITNVIFHTTPHMAFDYIFFHIASYLKIKKMIFFRTYYEDTILIADDYRKDLFKPFINHEINDKIDILKKNISAWGKVGVSINQISLKNSNLSGFINFLKIIAKKIKYTFFNKQLQSYNLLNINNNFFIFIYLHILHLVKTYQLRNKYKILSKKINYDNEYIFFAMHNQPEKTTNPEGEEYDNQINAIKFLRKIIDKKIRIYVKEHPKQLSPYTGDVRQLHSRSKKDYNLINMIENCHFLDIDSDINKIVKKSKLNVTISGTVAWQSLLESVPSITFANTWHSNCKSSPTVSRDKYIAIEQISNLLTKNKNEIKYDMENFSNEIKNKIFNTSISDFEIQNSSNDKSLLKKNLYEAIIKNL
tara:strand:- start:1588 stop:3030 length:1443 start_codon:yes stop_codon:yes gene_type:complete